MDPPILDSDFKAKIPGLDFKYEFGEWVTEIGNHRLIEIIVSYYSGYKYSLDKFEGNNYQIGNIFKQYSHLRKRKDQTPSKCQNIQLRLNLDTYWFIDSLEDTFMLDVK